MKTVTLKRWQLGVLLLVTALISTLIMHAGVAGRHRAEINLYRGEILYLAEMVGQYRADQERLALERDYYRDAYLVSEGLYKQERLDSERYLRVAIEAQQQVTVLKRTRLEQHLIDYVQSVNPKAPAAEIVQTTLQVAERYGLNPLLLLGQMHVESRFEPNAVSKTGARCLMQIVKSTAEQELGVVWDRIFDIETCIDAGARYMVRHLERYGGDVDAALARYCGGCDPYYEAKVHRAIYRIQAAVPPNLKAT